MASAPAAALPFTRRTADTGQLYIRDEETGAQYRLTVELAAATPSSAGPAQLTRVKGSALRRTIEKVLVPLAAGQHPHQLFVLPTDATPTDPPTAHTAESRTELGDEERLRESAVIAVQPCRCGCAPARQPSPSHVRSAPSPPKNATPLPRAGLPSTPTRQQTLAEELPHSPAPRPPSSSFAAAGGSGPDIYSIATLSACSPTASAHRREDRGGRAVPPSMEGLARQDIGAGEDWRSRDTYYCATSPLVSPTRGTPHSPPTGTTPPRRPQAPRVLLSPSPLAEAAVAAPAPAQRSDARRVGSPSSSPQLLSASRSATTSISFASASTPSLGRRDSLSAPRLSPASPPSSSSPAAAAAASGARSGNRSWRADPALGSVESAEDPTREVELPSPPRSQPVALLQAPPARPSTSPPRRCEEEHEGGLRTPGRKTPTRQSQAAGRAASSRPRTAESDVGSPPPLKPTPQGRHRSAAARAQHTPADRPSDHASRDSRRQRHADRLASAASASSGAAASPGSVPMPPTAAATAAAAAATTPVAPGSSTRRRHSRSGPHADLMGAEQVATDYAHRKRHDALDHRDVTPSASSGARETSSSTASATVCSVTVEEPKPPGSTTGIWIDTTQNEASVEEKVEESAEVQRLRGLLAERQQQLQRQQQAAAAELQSLTAQLEQQKRQAETRAEDRVRQLRRQVDRQQRAQQVSDTQRTRTRRVCFANWHKAGEAAANVQGCAESLAAGQRGIAALWRQTLQEHQRRQQPPLSAYARQELFVEGERLAKELVESCAYTQTQLAYLDAMKLSGLSQQSELDALLQTELRLRHVDEEQRGTVRMVVRLRPSKAVALRAHLKRARRAEAAPVAPKTPKKPTTPGTRGPSVSRAPVVDERRRQMWARTVRELVNSVSTTPSAYDVTADELGGIVELHDPVKGPRQVFCDCLYGPAAAGEVEGEGEKEVEIAGTDTDADGRGPGEANAVDDEQRRMFADQLEPLLTDMCQSGRGVTVIGYGATGSGKTHTLLGAAASRGLYVSPSATATSNGVSGRAVGSGAQSVDGAEKEGEEEKELDAEGGEDAVYQWCLSSSSSSSSSPSTLSLRSPSSSSSLWPGEASPQRLSAHTRVGITDVRVPRLDAIGDGPVRSHRHRGDRTTPPVPIVKPGDGLLPRALAWLCMHAQAAAAPSDGPGVLDFSLSVVEVYNDRVYDLLADPIPASERDNLPSGKARPRAAESPSRSPGPAGRLSAGASVPKKPMSDRPWDNGHAQKDVFRDNPHRLVELAPYHEGVRRVKGGSGCVADTGRWTVAARQIPFALSAAPAAAAAAAAASPTGMHAAARASYRAAMRWLRVALERRRSCATTRNPASSRSHMIVKLRVRVLAAAELAAAALPPRLSTSLITAGARALDEWASVAPAPAARYPEQGQQLPRNPREVELIFCDLAGSERLDDSSTGATAAERCRETQYINRSLRAMAASLAERAARAPPPDALVEAARHLLFSSAPGAVAGAATLLAGPASPPELGPSTSAASSVPLSPTARVRPAAADPVRLWGALVSRQGICLSRVRRPVMIDVVESTSAPASSAAAALPPAAAAAGPTTGNVSTATVRSLTSARARGDGARPAGSGPRPMPPPVRDDKLTMLLQPALGDVRAEAAAAATNGGRAPPAVGASTTTLCIACIAPGSIGELIPPCAFAESYSTSTPSLVSSLPNAEDAERAALAEIRRKNMKALSPTPMRYPQGGGGGSGGGEPGEAGPRPPKPPTAAALLQRMLRQYERYGPLLVSEAASTLAFASLAEADGRRRR